MVEHNLVHERATGKAGGDFRVEFFHVVFRHDDDVLIEGLFFQGMKHGQQLMVSAQNKDVVLGAVTHGPVSGRFRHIVDDVVEH